MTNIDWKKYRHAYGSAEDIPALLADLQHFPDCDPPRAEPYFTLWSSLCHQDDVYTGSYAALPRLVAAMEGQPQAANWSTLLLAISIEISRLKGNGPAVPDELGSSYAAAVARLPALAQALASKDCDELMARVAAAAIPTARGYPDLADGILHLNPDDIDRMIAAVYD